jgi:uncharacterized protein (DUF305 family)
MSIIRRSTRAAVLGAALVLSVTLSACSGGAAPSAAPTTAEPTVSAPGDDGAQHNDADIRFAQMMIPHHQQALDMAELAVQRAQRPEVKALAEQIRAAQNPEIDTLTDFLTAWDSQPMEGGMTGMDHSGSSGMMVQGDMDALATASGAAFDTKFLEMMIVHHEGAIADAQRQVTDGANAQAKDLAAKIVSDQSAEVERMRELLA